MANKMYVFSVSNTMPLKKYSSLLDLGSNGRHNTSLLDNTNTFKSPAPLRLSGFSDTLSTIQPVAPLMTTSLSNTLPLQEKLDQQNKVFRTFLFKTTCFSF